MRIEQPAHLAPLYRESARRTVRGLVQGPMLAFVGVVPSLISSGMLALRTSAGESVSASRWAVGLTMGPLMIALGALAFWVLTSGNRFAEIRGALVRLGPDGYSFRPHLLVYCKIEPDPHFPEVSHLCFCFRLHRWLRPRYWTMMAEDLTEAEAFRSEVEGRADVTSRL